MRKKWLRRIGIAALVGVAGLNALAYFHAGAMTRWAPAGERTQRPEELSWVQRAGVLLTGVSIPRPENSLTPADVGLAFETHDFENGRGAASVRCPTLVLQGGRDPTLSSEEARAICDRLGGWKHHSEYTKAGHEDVRSADPLRWKEDVAGLLAELRS